jgi:predicted MFS family arabinose efflux permease
MNGRILILACGMIACGMNSFLIAGLLPEIAQTLNTVEAVVGASVAVHSITYALTGPFIPIAFARFSRRAIMLTSMSLLMAGILLSAFAADIGVFYVARGITGLGTAAFTAQAMAAAIEIAPRGRSGAAATWVGMGFAVSMALGVPAGTLLGGAFGYRAAFLLTAGIAALTAVGLVTMRVAARPDAPSMLEQFRPFASGSVLAVLLAVLLYSFSFFTVLTYLHPILVDGAGVDGGLVAAGLAVFGVCNIVSMLIGGHLVDRFGGLPVVIGCVVAMGVATPLMGAPIGLAAFLAITVFGLTGSVVGPASNVELGTMHPGNPATIIGANMSTVQVGAAIGSATGAALLAGPGASWIAYAAGPPALAAGLIGSVLLAIRRGQQRRGPMKEVGTTVVT